MQAINFRSIIRAKVKGKVVELTLINNEVCTSEYETEERAVQVFNEITNNTNFPCIVFK